MTLFVVTGDLSHGTRLSAETVASWRETDPGDMPSGEYGVDWCVVRADSAATALSLWNRREKHHYEDLMADLFAVEAVS